MLIADTFKLDRLYMQSFRKLMVVSFQQRGRQSIQNILQVDLPAADETKLSRVKENGTKHSRKELSSIASRVATQHSSGMQSTPKNFRSSLNTEEVRRKDETSRGMNNEEQVINFLDSSLAPIHTNMRDPTIRKTRRLQAAGMRCST